MAKARGRGARFEVRRQADLAGDLGAEQQEQREKARREAKIDERLARKVQRARKKESSAKGSIASPPPPVSRQKKIAVGQTLSPKVRAIDPVTRSGVSRRTPKRGGSQIAKSVLMTEADIGRLAPQLEAMLAQLGFDPSRVGLNISSQLPINESAISTSFGLDPAIVSRQRQAKMLDLDRFALETLEAHGGKIRPASRALAKMFVPGSIQQSINLGVLPAVPPSSFSLSGNIPWPSVLAQGGGRVPISPFPSFSEVGFEGASQVGRFAAQGGPASDIGVAKSLIVGAQRRAAGGRYRGIDELFKVVRSADAFAAESVGGLGITKPALESALGRGGTNFFSLAAPTTRKIAGKPVITFSKRFEELLKLGIFPKASSALFGGAILDPVPSSMSATAQASRLAAEAEGAVLSRGGGLTLDEIELSRGVPRGESSGFQLGKSLRSLERKSGAKAMGALFKGKGKAGGTAGLIALLALPLLAMMLQDRGGEEQFAA